MGEFNLLVMSPGEILYDGKATSIVVPTLSGYIGILPGHIPLLSVLVSGKVEIKNVSEVKSISLNGGVIDITSEMVSIITQ